MSLRPYENEAHVIAPLCRAAAKRAMEIARAPLHVVYKDGDDKSPVTEADKAANAILMEGIHKAFPLDGFCAEEASETHAFDSRKHQARIWCIDPIDGTREFIAGTGQYAIMVGLAVDGHARFGAVYEPARDHMFVGATDGHGARWATWEGGGQIHDLAVSDIAPPHDIRLMVSRHNKTRTLDALCHALPVHARVPLGSVGLKMSRIARGEAELYACVTDKIHAWDACGPAAILEGAGGRATDLAGRTLLFNQERTNMPSGLLASNGAAHDHAVRALQQAATRLPHLARLVGDVRHASKS